MRLRPTHRLRHPPGSRHRRRHTRTAYRASSSPHTAQQVTIYDLAEAQRDAAIDYVTQELPTLAEQLAAVSPVRSPPRPTSPRPLAKRGW